MKYKDKMIAAREYRKFPTKAEKILWSVLRNKQLLNLKFRRQHVIDGFILDFYCPALKLGIEVIGSVHNNLENQKYDEDREKILKQNGITLIYVESEAVEIALPAVVRAIQVGINHTLASKAGEGRPVSRPGGERSCGRG